MKDTAIMENQQRFDKEISEVSSRWTLADYWGNFKVRCNIGRMQYTVPPGLYALGSPDRSSEVFVTANYKLSFDLLRKSLMSHTAWLLVLDTKGINVWCAAGKSTFGTEELIHRIQSTHLAEILSHHRVILPQLGAVGIAAHVVKKETGFHVLYGPVRAADLPAFISSGYRANATMRKVEFPLRERMKLIPVELSYGRKYLILVPLLFFILSGISSKGYSPDLAWREGGIMLLNLGSAYATGSVLLPILLPWLPFRRFSLKGLLLSIPITTLVFVSGYTGETWLETLSWFLMNTALASFMSMNFTGSSTFTSLSGVQKEMKTALPLEIAGAALGIILWIITRFI